MHQFEYVCINYVVDHSRLVGLWMLLLDEDLESDHLLGVAVNTLDCVGKDKPVVVCQMDELIVPADIATAELFDSVYLLSPSNFPEHVFSLVMNDTFVKDYLIKAFPDSTLIEQMNIFFNSANTEQHLEQAINDGCLLIGVNGNSEVHLNRSLHIEGQTDE